MTDTEIEKLADALLRRMQTDLVNQFLEVVEDTIERQVETTLKEIVHGVAGQIGTMGKKSV